MATETILNSSFSISEAGNMKITFLGTGTSIGVPEIGCTCKVCRSTDPRDRRMRCSALVDSAGGTRILMDCGPDFYQQMQTVDYRRIDGVLITHEHFDHTGGLDDLRPFCRFGDVDIWLDAYTAGHLRERLPYFFKEKLYPGVARLRLHETEPGDVFMVGDVRVMPLRVRHGQLPILGYRMDAADGSSIGYITDMSDCPEETVDVLCGRTEETKDNDVVDTLVVNALRMEPHPSHECLAEAIRFARRVGARQTRFVHFSHGIGLHAETCKLLPEGMSLAFDGMKE